MNKALEKIVIVGGGSSGWIAAAALARALKNTQCKVTLVESPDIPTIGVGEATIPTIVKFISYLGVDEREFMAATDASFKLGIKFEDWHSKGASYWHPFGSIGVNIDNKEFFHYWAKSRLTGGELDLSCFSPAAAMADAGCFFHPQRAANDSFLRGASYAYHFDASLVAKFLQKYAVSRGVELIKTHVDHAVIDKGGFISSVECRDGSRISGDFFIDCTGFRSLLIDEAMNVGWEDWSSFLPCDRAIAFPTDNDNKILPYTKSTAKKFGWQWNIPLQKRTGNGYVYSSAFASEDQVMNELSESFGGTRLDARVVKFKTGRRKAFWEKNCLALGLSAGFVEPLESTAIHLVMKGIRGLIELFPDKTCSEPLANEYNRILADDYISIRDFVILHYCATKRTDTEFWRWCQQEMPVPDTLQTKIALFESQGRLQFNPADLFKAPSWHSVFTGMGILPKAYDPLIDATDWGQANAVLGQVHTLMGRLAQGLPNHRDYLMRYCSASRQPSDLTVR